MDRIYFVKQDIGLFKKKGAWMLALGGQTIGMYPDREAALASAIDEAERTSKMGLATEVWVNDGAGFLLAKAFQPSKGKSKDEESVEDEKPEDDDGDLL